MFRASNGILGNKKSDVTSMVKIMLLQPSFICMYCISLTICSFLLFLVFRGECFVLHISVKRL